MASERWLRLLPRTFLSDCPEDDKIRVLVPQNVWHFILKGVATQNELIGPGEADVKMVIPASPADNWTYADALDFCVDEFSEWKIRFGEDRRSAYMAVVYDQAECLEGAKLERPILSRNGRFSQEISIPEATWRKIFDVTSWHVSSFIFLREVGHLCIANGNFDVQPHDFRNWCFNVFTGHAKPPGKAPERWGTYSRDCRVNALVQRLQAAGIPPTRNDASDPVSAYDCIAEASIRAGVRGISSYSNVKRIHQTFRKLSGQR